MHGFNPLTPMNDRISPYNINTISMQYQYNINTISIQYQYNIKQTTEETGLGDF